MQVVISDGHIPSQEEADVQLNHASVCQTKVDSSDLKNGISIAENIYLVVYPMSLWAI